jgi:aldose 1-epimerase
MTYTHIAHTQKAFEHYHYQSDGFSCKVFPHLGASIQELTIGGIPIIKELPLTNEGIQHYRTNYPSAILFPFPNRVAEGKYVYDTEKFQLTINEPSLKNAIHGLVGDTSFEVVNLEDDSISLRHTHYSSPGFPFPYDLIISYFFSESGLQLKFEVSNTGEKTFPFGLGWHPYFEVGDYSGCSLHFSAEKKYLNDDQMVPIDSEIYLDAPIYLSDVQLDTAYKLNKGYLELNTPKYQLQMYIPDGSYVQLYTPTNGESVAIEPMTCIANAFNNGVGLKELTPNEQYKLEVKISIKM